MADDKAKEEGKPKKKGNIFLWFGPLLFMAIVLPSTIVLIAMMLPSAIALMVDTRPSRPLFSTVAATNFSGVIPPWIALIEGGHNFTVARRVVTDIDHLMMAYGAALAGLAVYFIIVPVVSYISARAADAEKNKIEKQQKKLIDLWGEGVSK